MNEQTTSKNFRAVILLLLFVVVCAGVIAAAVVSHVSIPENVGRELTAKEQHEIIENNSPLTSYVRLSPNADFPRTEPITKITIHHMGDDDLDLVRLGEVFSDRDRRASANYAISNEGKVALYVEEANRSWASSNAENDQQAITIEVENSETGSDWRVGYAAYNKLIELMVDICERNGIEELVYTGDATGNLTYHAMFSETTDCPGPYLISKMPAIAHEVNAQLAQRRNNA